jgi:hypothetical protein
MNRPAMSWWSARNSLQGMAIYAIGDLVAQIILQEVQASRILGVMLLGGTLYALEIPNWFAFIDRRVTTQVPTRRALQRTALALLYFNPLWIARHLLFLRVFSGNWQQVNGDLLRLGLLSWLANLPLAMCANWLIQVRVSLRWRFLASAIFSGLMAVYYAVSTAWL